MYTYREKISGINLCLYTLQVELKSPIFVSPDIVRRHYRCYSWRRRRSRRTLYLVQTITQKVFIQSLYIWKFTKAFIGTKGRSSSIGTIIAYYMLELCALFILKNACADNNSKSFFQSLWNFTKMLLGIKGRSTSIGTIIAYLMLELCPFFI